MPKWSDDEQAYARKFQKAHGQPVIGLQTPGRRRSELGRRRRPRTTMAMSPGWCRPAALNFPASGPGHRLARMAGRGHPDQHHRAQGAGRRRQDAGRHDHRSADVARSCCRRRGRSSRWRRRDALFLAGAARRQAGRRAQQGRDGEISRRHEEVLSEQGAAV